MTGRNPQRTFDSGGSRVYEVVSVKDPDQAGWYQLRDPIRHKGIPDSALPWGSTGDCGAATHNVGETPQSKYLVGSHCLCSHSDAMGLSPVIQHAINKAGDSQSGTSVDGGPVTNKDSNSTPKFGRDDPGDEQMWMYEDPPGTEEP